MGKRKGEREEKNREVIREPNKEKEREIEAEGGQNRERT